MSTRTWTQPEWSELLESVERDLGAAPTGAERRASRVAAGESLSDILNEESEATSDSLLGEGDWKDWGRRG